MLGAAAGDKEPHVLHWVGLLLSGGSVTAPTVALTKMSSWRRGKASGHSALGTSPLREQLRESDLRLHSIPGDDTPQTETLETQEAVTVRPARRPLGAPDVLRAAQHLPRGLPSPGTPCSIQWHQSPAGLRSRTCKDQGHRCDWALAPGPDQSSHGGHSPSPPHPPALPGQATQHRSPERGCLPEAIGPACPCHCSRA